jgi:hypothetical protein
MALQTAAAEAAEIAAAAAAAAAAAEIAATADAASECDSSAAPTTATTTTATTTTTTTTTATTTTALQSEAVAQSAFSPTGATQIPEPSVEVELGPTDFHKVQAGSGVAAVFPVVLWCCFVSSLFSVDTLPYFLLWYCYVLGVAVLFPVGLVLVCCSSAFLSFGLDAWFRCWSVSVGSGKEIFHSTPHFSQSYTNFFFFCTGPGRGDLRLFSKMGKWCVSSTSFRCYCLSLLLTTAFAAHFYSNLVFLLHCCVYVLDV